MTYERNQFTIHSERGIPCSPRWFCDGRLSFGYDEKGIYRLEYFMPIKDNGNSIIFRRGIFDCFRCSVRANGLRYCGDYQNTGVTPFGLCSDWSIGADKGKYGVYAVNEAVVFSFESAFDCDFVLSWYASTQFIPTDNGEIDGGTLGYRRSWHDWSEDDGMLLGGFTDARGDDAYTLYAAVVSNRQMQHCRSAYNDRHECTLHGNGTQYFGILFGTDLDNLKMRAKQFSHSFSSYIEQQNQRYLGLQARTPILHTGIEELDAFAALAPYYHESLKPRDLPGTVRAKTSRYWVWGWDTMISNLCSFLWGDDSYLEQMLDYYASVYDPNTGLPHASCYDGSNSTVPAPSSLDGIFIVLLEQYGNLCNDTSLWRKHHSTVAQMLQRLIASQSKIPGLFVGTSLFPDFPKCLKENGRDISLFNNSIYYAMLRAAEHILLSNGDSALAAQAHDLFCQMEQTFFRSFFNREKGYFTNSIDADTLVQRDCINYCGYFWDSDYHEELLGLFSDKCIDSVLKNAMSLMSFRAFPLWDDSFDADANQFHCTWGAVEEVLLRLGKNTEHREPTNLWIKKLRYWMSKLTCPEGESFAYETETPELDRWNSESGTWQAYTARKWYSELFGVILGLSFDRGGLTFSVPQIQFSLSNLNMFGKRFRIRTEGSGDAIESIIVNGHKLCGSLKAPTDLLLSDAENDIVIVLGKPQMTYLARATGMVLTDYSMDNDRICCQASGLGTSRLLVHGDAEILIDGKLCPTRVASGYTIAEVTEWLPDRMHDVEIVSKILRR